jgi:spermidine synthase
MCLKDPDKLSLAYTRKMMAFLLFNRSPTRILLLGLGGGSLAKFCYRRLPRTAITAVELNSDVIALRAEFRVPPDDDRFRVIRADGADYLAQLGRSKDVIIADACDRTGIAPELDAIEVYQHVYRSLTQRGVFVSNICGDVSNRTVHLSKIRRVFADNFLTLQVAPDGNVIVLAFKGHLPEIDWEKLEVASTRLKRIFSLDFPRFARRLALDWKLRRWQCVSN